ncbi:unnamed protein product [Lactuca saligna]|uniref:Uncharacterized protein n=1 Tax=Lactuca saligna TaxID=75948 RepID=A0AA35VPR2_LACSI|nr:unnamed protein product [Lactuca saligna]
MLIFELARKKPYGLRLHPPPTPPTLFRSSITIQDFSTRKPPTISSTLRKKTLNQPKTNLIFCSFVLAARKGVVQVFLRGCRIFELSSREEEEEDLEKKFSPTSGFHEFLWLNKCRLIIEKPMFFVIQVLINCWELTGFSSGLQWEVELIAWSCQVPKACVEVGLLSLYGLLAFFLT